MPQLTKRLPLINVERKEIDSTHWLEEPTEDEHESIRKQSERQDLERTPIVIPLAVAVPATTELETRTPKKAKSTTSKRRGRPKSSLVQIRRQFIRDISERGFQGEAYCRELDKKIATRKDWQLRDGCPERYQDAWNHYNTVKRAEFRQKINGRKVEGYKEPC